MDEITAEQIEALRAQDAANIPVHAKWRCTDALFAEAAKYSGLNTNLLALRAALDYVGGMLCQNPRVAALINDHLEQSELPWRLVTDAGEPVPFVYDRMVPGVVERAAS